MKKIVKFLLYIICVLPFIGCSEGEIDDIEKNEESITSEYYVKYYVQVNNAITEYSEVNISYSLPNNKTETFVYGGTGKTLVKEIVIGPFGYADKLSLAVSKTDEKYRIKSIDTEILVSKNNSPFALKKYGASSIGYTIDY